MKLNLKAASHGVGQNVYHLVFKTKYALPLFSSVCYHKVCEGAFKLIACQNGFVIYEMQIMPEHVHLFVDIKPSVSVSKAIQLFKGVSSRIMRRNFSYLRQSRNHLWSPGKFYRSVGNVSAEVIQNYIKYSQGSWSLPDNKLPSYYKQKCLPALV